MADAVGYRLEIDDTAAGSACPGGNTGFSPVDTTDTQVTVNWPAATAGCWRVRALYSGGRASPFTGYRNFRYP